MLAVTDVSVWLCNTQRLASHTDSMVDAATTLCYVDYTTVVTLRRLCHIGCGCTMVTVFLWLC